MDKKSNDSLELDTLSEIARQRATVISPQLQKIANIAAELNNAVVSAIRSEAMQAILSLGQKVAETMASLSFAPILENLSNALIPLYYIAILEEVKWPAFLINDISLRDRIMAVCKEKSDEAAVTDILMEYCSDSYVESLLCDWLNCGMIAEDRKNILSEAIQLHKLGFYYGAVSTLICQLYGIADDVANIAQSKNLRLDSEAKDFVAEHFGMERRFIDNEKGRLMQAFMFVEDRVAFWDAIAKYFKEVVFFSGRDYSALVNQPLRNKIGHGDQLNFGTKEHSLKAILTIDLLVQLAIAISQATTPNEDMRYI